MTRQTIRTEAAPKAVGPYSQACFSKDGQTLYLSGQIPLDPQTGELITGSISEQTTRCMENLKAVLQAARLDFDNVVRCTIYLTDLNDFSEVNEVYGAYFSDPAPARACVQVGALPKGAAVEIDAIAENDR